MYVCTGVSINQQRPGPAGSLSFGVLGHLELAVASCTNARPGTQTRELRSFRGVYACKNRRDSGSMAGRLVEEGRQE